MGKKTKYPNDELSDEEERIIDRLAFLYVGVYSALIQKYRTPKRFAEKVILKKVISDTNIAKLYTLTSTIKSPVNQLLEPRKINDQLARNIQNTIDKNHGDINIAYNGGSLKKFLNPVDLRERVLSPFEKQGIFLHLEGKKEIKLQQGQATQPRPGKKKSSEYSETTNDHGGKPSGYMATEKVEKVKRLMQKPAAIDLFYKRLLRSDLANRFFRFNLLAFLYASKTDKRVIHRMAGLGASFSQQDIDVDDFKATFEILQTFDDRQMEQYADSLIKCAIDKGRYATLFALGVFTGGLLPI